MAALNPSTLVELGQFKGSVVTRLSIAVTGNGVVTALVISGRASPMSEWKVLTDDPADYNKSALINGVAVTDGKSLLPHLPAGVTGYVYINAGGYYDLKVEAAGSVGCYATCESEVNLAASSGAGTIGVTPVGNLTSTDLQSALAELDGDITTVAQAVAALPAPTPAYTLPAATAAVRGGVKIGSGITLTGDVISVPAASTYTLPVATSSVLGGVKGGGNVSIAGDGTLSVTFPAAPTKADLGLGNVDNTSDANKPVSTATAAALATKQDTSAKNASGGYAGLDVYRLSLKSNTGTVTSLLENNATTARSWVLPDKSGTVAMTSDIPTSTGAMVLLASMDIVATSEVSFPTLFANDYREYLVLFRGIKTSVDTMLALRFAEAGASITGSVYYSNANGASATSTQAYGYVTAQAVRAGYHVNGSIRISADTGGGWWSTTAMAEAVFQNSSAQLVYSGAFTYTEEPTPATGFSLLPTSGTLQAGGNIRVYGIKKA